MVERRRKNVLGVNGVDSQVADHAEPFQVSVRIRHRIGRKTARQSCVEVDSGQIDGIPCSPPWLLKKVPVHAEGVGQLRGPCHFLEVQTGGINGTLHVVDLAKVLEGQFIVGAKRQNPLKLPGGIAVSAQVTVERSPCHPNVCGIVPLFFQHGQQIVGSLIMPKGDFRVGISEDCVR